VWHGRLLKAFFFFFKVSSFSKPFILENSNFVLSGNQWK
jgi:hypothetical protein